MLARLSFAKLSFAGARKTLFLLAVHPPQTCGREAITGSASVVDGYGPCVWRGICSLTDYGSFSISSTILGNKGADMDEEYSARIDLFLLMALFGDGRLMLLIGLDHPLLLLISKTLALARSFRELPIITTLSSSRSFIEKRSSKMWR